MNFRAPGRTRLRPAPFLLALLSLPALAQDHWIRVTTTHFEMYTTSEEKKAREAILHFERVREFFIQASPVKPPGEFPTRIVAFRDAQVMHIYSPYAAAVAYYAPGPLRDSIVMQDPSPASYPVTIHEYVHLVIRHSGLHIPTWLNEGWAEVYSTLKPVKDGMAVGDLIPRHMTTLGQGRWFSLNELEAINNHSPDYNESSRAGMFYAESWALTHMLYLSPDYKENFGKFLSGLNRGRTLEESLQAAFGKNASQVLADLRVYLSRKNLYGTVFLTPLEKSGEAPVVTPVAPYDVELELADLHAASLHTVPARLAYRQLEEDDPKRPDAYAGEGYLAVRTGDKEAARTQFRKAFDLGTTDAQLCMQLATLDREAKQPPEVVMEELERAIKLRPDFSEAIFQLAMLKVDMRDFDTALSLLGRVGTVGPDRMTIYRSALAYTNLQRGNIDGARYDAQAARRAAKTPSETQAADRLLALIEARSKGPAAALPGEHVVRTQGTAVGLRCSAPGSGNLSQMGITINGKPWLFDMPDAAAVEITRQPGTKAEIKCGALQPFAVVVEYAPASVANRETAGIIRRLEF
jgi:tetratricopeptide (TPR) repeat protein